MDSPIASLKTVIPVVVETLNIERVVYHTGTVRIRKVVHHDANAVHAPGMQESVETTRVPIDRVVEATVGPHQHGDLLIVPVYEERWVRQLVLVEEIHVVKRRTELTQSGPVALRREEIVVERLDPVTDEWVSEPSP